MLFFGGKDDESSAMSIIKVGVHIALIVAMIVLIIWLPANYDGWWVWLVVAIAFIILVLSSLGALLSGGVKMIKSVF